MKTAKEFAEAATRLSQLADQLKPAPECTFSTLQNVISYHLRVAAKDLRSIAEVLAEKKGIAKGESAS
jgi:hypothetical protein